MGHLGLTKHKGLFFLPCLAAIFALCVPVDEEEEVAAVRWGWGCICQISRARASGATTHQLGSVSLGARREPLVLSGSSAAQKSRPSGGRQIKTGSVFLQYTVKPHF